MWQVLCSTRFANLSKEERNMNVKDGGQAFPTHAEYSKVCSDGYTWHHGTVSGMSLRDWFAGQAVAGLMSNTDFLSRHRSDDIARAAFKVADALLEFRKSR